MSILLLLLLRTRHVSAKRLAFEKQHTKGAKEASRGGQNKNILNGNQEEEERQSQSPKSVSGNSIATMNANPMAAVAAAIAPANNDDDGTPIADCLIERIISVRFPIPKSRCCPSAMKFQSKFGTAGNAAIATNTTAPAMCRVCRLESDTPAQPLFSPCRCSGSIKFVHQDW